MTFHVGMKVVCVDDVDQAYEIYATNHVTKGAIYTIRGFQHEPTIQDIGIYLEEVVNPSIEWSDGDICEWSFKASRFRPIVPRKTDISTLTALLVPGAKIREDA